MAGLLKRWFSRGASAEADSYAPVNDRDDVNEGVEVPEDDWSPPEVEGASVILNEEQVGYLDRQLPKRLVCSRWILAFSTATQGFSLANLYRSLHDWTGPTLIVVQDSQGHRFGAFVTDSLRPDHKVRGGGECFVFRLCHPDFSSRFNGVRKYGKNGGGRKPSACGVDFVVVNAQGELEMGIELEMDEDHFGQTPPVTEGNSGKTPNKLSEQKSDHDKSASPNGVASKTEEIIPSSTPNEQPLSNCNFSEHQVWRWAGLHNCFIHGQADQLHVGLHDGKMSLWLDDNIERGCSQESAVFNNEPLAPNPSRPDGTFKVVNAEVWIFKQ